MCGDTLERVMRVVEEFLEEVSKRFRVEEAYLFGSYARGDWIKSSDIDLVIVSRHFEGMSFSERLEVLYRLEWEKKITPHIEVIPLTPRELRERLEKSAVLRDASKYWVRVK